LVSGRFANVLQNRTLFDSFFSHFFAKQNKKEYKKEYKRKPQVILIDMTFSDLVAPVGSRWLLKEPFLSWASVSGGRAVDITAKFQETAG